ncbi:PTS system mannitol-specific IIC component [Catenulispora sp. MAP12-49]|uniref:mannitol-specific PTS transporter subunit IIC n=1 Tax=Catenulispora sp. MAP12-49 TaxID=3156302 RepID=UPI003517727C
MSSMAYTPVPTGTGLKAKVQKFGSFLASMVMPNIGAFIAWGLITALFIPTGWTPNSSLGELVSPMITYLLPILIGYTGGRIVHGQRGAVIGAIATTGVVVGSSVPMFLGAMIAGPASAWVLKQFDKLTADRLRAGFEMLVDNFSLGIIGGAFAVLGKLAIGPAVNHVTDWAGHGVNWVLNHHLLPFVSILIEPAKVLFLNNAINHGVLDPLAVAQAAGPHHRSILFMLESNPGPGLGILCAYLLFGPRALRPTVPGAIVIQFLGGIHEIYFPYILMKPRLILAAIAGGFAGISVFSVTGAGLVASPSPGSIFAYLTETPRGSYFGVLAGVVVAAAVSFVVASLLLGFGRGEKAEEAEETQDADEAAAVPAQSSPEGATA